MRRLIVWLTGLALMVASAGQVSAGPLTITATASGSVSPTQFVNNPFDPTHFVTNGDFRIYRSGNPNSAEDFLIGEGIDEHTSWVLDFTQDGNFSDFDTSEPLTSVLLTITLTGAIGGNDRVDIFGLGQSTAPNPPDLNAGVIELVNFSSQYNGPNILQSLINTQAPSDPRRRTAGFGQLLMSYADDAIVSFVKVELTGSALPSPPPPEPVPEPSSLILLGMGAVSLFGFSYRRKRKQTA